MVEVFGRSRINLNLSTSSQARNSLGRRLRRAVRRLFVGSPPSDADQIKGRSFEVPGCGGFLAFLLPAPGERMRTCFMNRLLLKML